jgi:hypothetical protein
MVTWLGSTKPPSKSEKPVSKTAKKGQAGGQLSGFRIVEVVKCATWCDQTPKVGGYLLISNI